jgi:polysaccharide biosynthesis protein PslG
MKANHRVIFALCVVFFVSGASAEPPTLPSLPIPECFGVAVHSSAGNAPLDAKHIRNTGFGWVRTDLEWSEVELVKGRYDFSAYDRIVNAFHKAGLRMVLIIDYTNKYYDEGHSPKSPEGREAFARFAVAAAKRYLDKGIIWEIYNEPNIFFWKPEPDVVQYVALAEEATNAIRKNVPEAIVVGPALAGPVPDEDALRDELEFLDRVLSSNVVKDWSAITIHPYRNDTSPEPPETALHQLALIRDMMRRHGLDPQSKPLSISEWGYSTWNSGVSERLQAAYAVRAMFLGMAERMPFFIWYDWQDDGRDASEMEHRFGLIRPTGDGSFSTSNVSAKPALNAIRQVADILRGYRFEEVVERDRMHSIISLVEEGRRAFVLWSMEDQTQPLSLNFLPAGSWKSVRILDHSEELGTALRERFLQVSAMPVILIQQD